MACANRGAVPFEQVNNYQCLSPEHTRGLLKACRSHYGQPSTLNFCQIDGHQLAAGCSDGKIVELKEILNWLCLSPYDTSRLLEWCRRRQNTVD